MTAVVGSASSPTPNRATRPARRPHSPSRSATSVNSAAARSPLIATTMPPGRATATLQGSSLGSGATARLTTTSPRTSAPSARARTTLTRRDSCSPVTTSSSHRTRRSNGSRRTTSRSGRASAIGMPGRPPPLPRSTTTAPGGHASATTALFSRCRVHSRSVSRGPTSPRSTPGPARSSAKARAAATSGKTWAAATGTGSVGTTGPPPAVGVTTAPGCAGAVSRGTGPSPVTRRTRRPGAPAPHRPIHCAALPRPRGRGRPCAGRRASAPVRHPSPGRLHPGPRR